MQMSGYQLVANLSDGPLPGPELSREEKSRMYGLQKRAHLETTDDRKREPLNEMERSDMEALEEQWRSSRCPKAGQMRYQFAAAGRPGSVWLVHHADIPVLLAQHPTTLRVTPQSDIQPLQHGYRPSIAEQTPGSGTFDRSRSAVITSTGVVGGTGWMPAGPGSMGPNPVE